MIVWLASFPRSGNTFLRILLNRLYGVRSSTVYDVDGVAQRLGHAFVGFEERAASYDEMRASTEVHFVKTHRQRDGNVAEGDKAICLVRDGRDSLVSWARMTSETDPARYESELRAMIARDTTIGTGSWGTNVLSWLVPPAENRVVVTYEALVADPVGATSRAIGRLLPDLTADQGAAPPGFAELREVDELFFRRGVSGSHRDELPTDLEALFWARPDNVAAMGLLEKHHSLH